MWMTVTLATLVLVAVAPPSSDRPPVQRPSNWDGPGTRVEPRTEPPAPAPRPSPPSPATPPTTVQPPPPIERAGAPTTAIPAPATNDAVAHTTSMPAPMPDRANAPTTAIPAPQPTPSAPTTSIPPPPYPPPPTTDDYGDPAMGAGVPLDQPTNYVGPPPAPGTGLFTGGIVAGSAGALTTLLTISLASSTTIAPSGSVSNTGPAVATGAASVVLLGGGATMVVIGRRRQLAYKRWLSASGIRRGKPAGHGLLVGGGTLLGLGAFSAISGAATGIGWPAYLAGAALAAGGGAMVGIGVKRKRAYSAWTGQLDVAWTPTLAPVPGGFSLGAAGRF